MKTPALLIAILLSTSCLAADIKLTPEEEKAIMQGMEGLMERLADPEWIKLMAESNEGCWLDKNTTVKAGAQTEYGSVASTCVSWDLGMGDNKPHMFIPTRVKNECDKAGLPYNKCVD